MTRVVRADVTTAPLDLARHEELVGLPTAGAVVSFAGVVRDHDHGREVKELEYEGHPTAATVLAEVAADIVRRRQVHAVAVSHRIGLLSIGDVALAAAVSSAHRAEAFEACRQLIDEVKGHLPIWKRQLFADGAEEWVNCP